MRYYVKAFTMHESEAHAAEDAIKDGVIQHAEASPAFATNPGFVQGITDEAGIERLTGQGLVVQAIAPVAEAAAAGDIGGNSPAFVAPVRPFAVAARAAAPTPGTQGMQGAGYALLNLPGGLTEGRRKALRDTGAVVVERDSPDWFVARLSANQTVSSLSFVALVKPYGIAETMSESLQSTTGPSVVPPPSGIAPSALSTAPLSSSTPRRPAQGLIEAILHTGENAAAASDAIKSLGAEVVASSGQVIRFLQGKSNLQSIAALPAVARLEPVQKPRLRNEIARGIVGLANASPGGSLPYRGQGELVGVADTGIDASHPDFRGRIRAAVARGRPDDSSDPAGHGTHVAGIILGDGSMSQGRSLAGVVPEAELFFQSILDANGQLGGLPENLSDLFQEAYDAGVRVHNNSWGAYVQSRYAGSSLQLDAFVHSHPDFLPVIAAGNEGSCRPGLQAAEGFVDFPSMGAPGTAKNGLTVGASRSSRTSGGYSTMTWGDGWPDDYNARPIRTETISGNPDELAGFSSRGPCDDMRIKPDVVAPGTDIASTRSRNAPLSNFWGAYPNNRHYAFDGGTSMACPLVAGCAVMIREYYLKVRHHSPSAALLKATLVNGTTELTSRGATAPTAGFANYHQGFGRVDMRTTIPAPQNPAFVLEYVDSNGAAGLELSDVVPRVRWRIRLSEPGDLRICMAWTDPPGRALQNILFMILDNRTNKWISNEHAAMMLRTPLGDPRLERNARVLTRDANNNIQVIRVPHAAPGEYTLAIFADTLTVGPQGFALAATGPIASFATV